jgi:hypothetical protein
VEQFETATRHDGTEYVRVMDGAPDSDALHDLLFEVHRNGATLPDDTFYRLAREALEYIGDNGESGDGHDFAEGSTDAYNSDLVAWLAEAPSLHGSYIEDAIEEYGMDAERGFFHMIMMGQYMQALEVFDAVETFLRTRVEE